MKRKKCGQNRHLLCGAVVAVFLLALTLSGCGADATQSHTEDGTAGAGVPISLKVGMAGKDIKAACIIVAKQLGYFEEEGLDVSFETVSNLSEGITAVDMGKLDILPFGVIPSATFISQGSDVVIFGGTISEGSEIIGRAEDKGTINVLDDFRGKRIGCYRMETGHMVMKGLLRQHGLDLEKDVEFMLLDSQQAIMEAVRKGEVDLGFVNSGQGYVAKRMGLEILNTAGSFQPDFPCCRQTTSRRTLEAKRDGLVRFEIANLRAYEIIHSQRETAVKALMQYSGQPQDYVEAVIYGLEETAGENGAGSGARAGEVKNYDSAMIISLDPNRNKLLEFYEVMKENGDIAGDTQYGMEGQIDVTVYQDALLEMEGRDKDNPLWKRLKKEYSSNN